MRKQKITLAIIAVLILAGFTYLAINSGITAQSLNVKTIKLESTENKLKDTNLQLESLKTQAQKDKEHQAELQKQIEQKEAEKQELQKQVQAKAEAREKLNIAAQKATQGQTASAAPRPVTGTKTEWMAQAGIPQEHWGYVDSIVTRESGWNPNAVNKSSGACGLGQQLPCGKWAGAWNDPVAALVAMTGYVNARYGGWGGAVAFWNANHWY